MSMMHWREYLDTLTFELKTVKGKHNYRYLESAGAFDTEFTSLRIGPDYEYKAAVGYVWMFGVGGPDAPVCYGRELAEFGEFVLELSARLDLDPDRCRLIVYSHAFKTEFQYVRKFVQWRHVFITENHSPLYALAECGVEFRDSLKLSGGRSLKTIGEELRNKDYRKKTGDLDYTLIRHPGTPLTDVEMRYCEYDIRTLLAYIQEKVEEEEKQEIGTLPLTNTGYVRRYIRDNTLKHQSYRKIIHTLNLTPDDYVICREAFLGGDTHANPYYVGRVLDNVGTADLTSSYPARMVLDYYPMSSFKYVGTCTEADLEGLITQYCCIFRVRWTGLESKLDFTHPLSTSKCTTWSITGDDGKVRKGIPGLVEENGRVVSAEIVETTLNEDYYKIYREFYTWETMEVMGLRIAKRGRLPKPFVLALLEIYGQKTTLKGNLAKITEYGIAKNMMNASFGMTVTDIVRKVFEYDTESNEFMSVQQGDIVESIEKYNKNPKRFLFYPWGIYVTSHARLRLYSAILAIRDDFVYCDTDCVKYLNPHLHTEYFETYNNRIMDDIKYAAKYYNVPVEKFAPIARNGKGYPIGQWEVEPPYEHFKTLGAKRYLVTLTPEELSGYNKEKHVLDGPYLLTCAGVNKAGGTNYLIKLGNPFEEFTDSMQIPPEFAGRLTHTYIDNPMVFTIADYLGNTYTCRVPTALHLEPSEFTLTLLARYIEYLKGIGNHLELEF